MQASARLVEAAEHLSQQPQAMQLRYLQTLSQIANEKTNTIVFPLPLDLIRPLMAIPSAAKTKPPARSRKPTSNGQGHERRCQATDSAPGPSLAPMVALMTEKCRSMRAAAASASSSW
jgi:hypothetical protein